MDFDAILNGLMNAGNWIEDVLINGLLGRGFGLLQSGILTPFINMLILMFGMG